MSSLKICVQLKAEIEVYQFCFGVAGQKGLPGRPGIAGLPGPAGPKGLMGNMGLPGRTAAQLHHMIRVKTRYLHRHQIIEGSKQFFRQIVKFKHVFVIVAFSSVLLLLLFFSRAVPSSSALFKIELFMPFAFTCKVHRTSFSPPTSLFSFVNT